MCVCMKIPSLCKSMLGTIITTCNADPEYIASNVLPYFFSIWAKTELNFRSAATTPRNNCLRWLK